MADHMEKLPRLHFNISPVLPEIQRHATTRASIPEIIASRLNIKLTSMQLTGETLYVFGDELAELDQKAKGSGQKVPDFILNTLSA